MYTIKTLNAISPVGLAKLPKNQFDVTVDADAPDGILVRSADLLNTTFNDNLLAIARAGAGVNNIPLDRCSEQGIVVFNTPGANANAVAELVIGMLIAGSRNVAAAAQWCQGLAGDPAMSKSVEKGKKQFVGNEIKGKTLGVIGLGAIGSRVANCAIELGMEVYGYDPYISIEAAWNLSSQVHHCVNLNDMLPLCDYITIHVPYLPTTKDTINAQTLALCKDGVKILNYARGELVNTAALLEAMDNGKVSGYMTDFPSEAILGRPGIVCTPHLGASTPEAEDNCAIMAAQELSDYLRNGNITHSVNLPEVHQPRAGGKRICIIHKNEPGMISQITALTTEAGLNIENMVNKSKKSIHHLKHMYLDIFKVAKERSIPVIYTLHDFYSICPSVKLFNKETFLCNYANAAGCGSCIAKTFNLNINFIPLWRKEFYENLKTVKKIIVPSYSTKNIFLNTYKDLTIEVVEHGYDKINGNPNNDNPDKKKNKKFNIAFIGYITEEKGLKYLEELTEKVKGTDINVHLFGQTTNKKCNKNKKNYVYHGKYIQQDLPNLLLENDIKLICLLSMWPETYSYTLSESLISEIPVISFDLGAIAERVKKADVGWILPINSTLDDIFKLISTIKSAPQEYKQKVERIRHLLKNMKSLKDMGNEYTEIYNKTINVFPVKNHDIYYIQSRNEFYRKGKETPTLDLKEEKKEYKRVKHIIKSSVPLKQAFNEVQNFRHTYTNSKCRNKIFFKFIWYRILRINI